MSAGRPRAWKHGRVSSANLTREETAARSASVTVRTVRVELDLTTAADADETGFATVSTLYLIVAIPLVPKHDRVEDCGSLARRIAGQAERP